MGYEFRMSPLKMARGANKSSYKLLAVYARKFMCCFNFYY